MKKPKGGLGQFLLKGFKRSFRGPKGRTRSASLKRRRVSRTLSVSRMRPQSPVTDLVVAPAKPQPDLQGNPQVNPQPVTPLGMDEKPVPIPPVPREQVPVPVPREHAFQNQAHFQAHSQDLSTHDFVRPNDQLRQSIEAFLLDQRSPHTRRAYGKDLKKFVQFLLARKYSQGVETLNRTILIAYKESLLIEKLEHTTIDRHLASLRSFFKWLVDDGILLRSPAEGVRFLRPKRLSTTNGFTDDEVKRVLSMPNLHTRTGALHYAILMILFYCGLRRSEVCDLRTSSLGMERNQRVLRLKGKGNSERIIVLIPAVWNGLRYYFHITSRDITHNEHLFLPLRNNRTGVLRKALDPSMIFYIVTRYSKLAGITTRVSPHSCRATAISNARDHQVPDRAIQEFAGWASPDMITRYDKRKTSVEDSAAHSILYGAENRPLPGGLNQAESSRVEPLDTSERVEPARMADLE